ncbi:MAG: M23 family metallopeptidase [Treponema sp.]|jgi:murein DD-endopeptidase MepM/ murein hydrolase activator NlpD|nr:M23 family metallopeptidase [Treponema sp.]
MKRMCFSFCVFFFLVNLAATQEKYAVIPENPRPGEPVTICAVGGVRKAALISGGKQLSASALFFTVPPADGKPGFLAAVLTVPSTAAPGDAVIRLENETGVVHEIPLTITEREFVSETIELDVVLTGIRTEPDPQKTAEADKLWAILNRKGTVIYHDGSFKMPVTSTRRTSFFGDRRIYKYSTGRSDTSIHSGVDFGVPTGTKVNACGSGRVVLSVMRIVTGNTVVIEHLPGIYSLYYHMDKLEVKEGAFVDTGELLGFSGATGLATGPHLHWEVRINGEYADPDAFAARPILDKNAVLSKIGYYLPMRKGGDYFGAYYD